MTTSDWYHDQSPVLMSQMLSASNPNGLPPLPEALLVNDGQHPVYNFTAGKTYKIRIISMAALASTLLQFDSHTMRIIEIDGVYVQKRDAYQIRVAPAQRFTVLLNAQTSVRRNYAFTASLDMNRDFKNDPSPVYPYNVTGYLMYDNKKAVPAPYVVPAWTSVQDDAVLVPYDKQALLGTPAKTIVLNFNFGLDSNSIPRSI
jgi:iron transport multicopper oxidase